MRDQIIKDQALVLVGGILQQRNCRYMGYSINVAASPSRYQTSFAIRPGVTVRTVSGLGSGPCSLRTQQPRCRAMPCAIYFPSEIDAHKLPSPRPENKMSRFYFGSDSDSDSTDPLSLPFPAPLSQKAFSAELDKGFSPTTFLASLHHRHHTLEDLRAELRARSKDLDTELLDLVNRDYEDFVGLGVSLIGGDRAAEDLKMGLWGFRRDVEGVVNRIGVVAEDVRRLLKVRDQIRKEKVRFTTREMISSNADPHGVDSCRYLIVAFATAR